MVSNYNNLLLFYHGNEFTIVKNANNFIYEQFNLLTIINFTLNL